MTENNVVTLRYLKGDGVTIALKKHPLALRHMKVTFAPTARVDKFLAQKILKNPRWMGWFGEEFVPPQTFVCETCGFVAKHRLGLMGHRKAHSDKIPHESRKTKAEHRRKPVPKSHPF